MVKETCKRIIIGVSDMIELKELEEFDEFSWIDLGYVLPGLIDLWEESEVD